MKKNISKVFAIILALTMLISVFSVSLTVSAVSGSEIVSYASQFEGCSYVYGAAGPNTFDCSGLVKYVFANFGIYLPHGSSYFWDSPSSYGTLIGENTTANAKPGDVISWPGHMGIYTGDGYCINALNYSAGVCYIKVNSFCDENWNPQPYKVIRIYGSEDTSSNLTPANLGDDFYGVILNKDNWKTISCDDDGFVRIRKESGKANQYWRFQRQSDGSYVISSAANGKALEMYNGDTTQGNQAAVASQYWGGNYQKWNIYEQNGGYVIASKHYPEKNLVLDMYNGDTVDGTNAITWQRKNSSNQIWAIYTGSESQLSSPFLFIDEIQPGKISFNWTEVYGENQYNLRVYKDSISSSNLYYSRSNVKAASVLTFSSPGKYIAVLDAVNYYQTKSSNNVTFTVNCNTITYNANGGSGAPSTQTKTTGQSIALSSTKPIRSGYTFKCWNTKADGTGTNYYPGGTYSANANVTLYAQWTANKKNFKVTYNANGGSSIIPYEYVEEGKTVALTTPFKNFKITYNANGGSNAPSATNVSVNCLGWSLSSTATTATYTCGSSYKPTSDVTLYAVWEKTGTVNLDSGTPTRDGYYFLGWSEDPNATKADFAPDETVNASGNVTLYAVWGTEPANTGYTWWEWIIIIVFFGWIWYV